MVPRLTTASGDISPSVARSAWEGGVAGPQPTAPGAPTGSEGFLQGAPCRATQFCPPASPTPHPGPSQPPHAGGRGPRSSGQTAPPAPRHLEEGTRGARAQRAPDRRRAGRPQSPGARGPGRGVGLRRHSAAPPGIRMETPAARGPAPAPPRSPPGSSRPREGAAPGHPSLTQPESPARRDRSH